MLSNSLWKWLMNKYGNPNVINLSIPIGILGNFDNRYITYNSEGQAIKGYKRLRDAIRACKEEEGIYLTRIID